MTDSQYARNQLTMTCVLCHNQETYWSAANSTGNSVKKRVYKPGPEVASFICSACVQKLLRIDQDQLSTARALAQSRESTVKAEALKSFKGNDDDQRTAKSGKPDHRSGPLRTIRMRQKTTCTPKTERRTAFYQHYKDKQALSRV